MNPIDKQQRQSIPYPSTYDEYVQLCQSRGVDPQLDQPLFESVFKDLEKLCQLRGDGEEANNAAAIRQLQELSEEKILQRLGISLHIDDLLNRSKD